MSEEANNQEVEKLEAKVSHLSKMLIKSFGYADQDPDTFLQNARKTTEAICKFIYTKEIGELNNKKMMLNDLSRALNTKKVIPGKISILIGTIQTYGNYGAHAQEDFSETTREWIAPCQTALANLTNWFFLEYLNGNVPPELLNPINDYSAENSSLSSNKKSFNQNSSKSSSKSLSYLLVIVIILLISGVAYFITKEFNKKSINKEIVINNPDPIKIAEGTNETIEKTSEDVIEKVNEITKNVNAKRIAIIYFDNSSNDKKLNQLKKGLADMMISDLSKVSMLDVVERARLEEILKEQKLNNSENFDTKTATKIGKLLGAEHILTGSFFELMGRLRIDARLIDVETGKIIKSEGIDGPTGTFFDLEKSLVTKMVSGFEVELQPEEKEAIKDKAGKISYKSSLLFSESLDLIDKGKNVEAIKNLEKVLKENPEFIPAKSALDKIKVII
jgi:TolB-like protein